MEQVLTLLFVHTDFTSSLFMSHRLHCCVQKYSYN